MTTTDPQTLTRADRLAARKTELGKARKAELIAMMRAGVTTEDGRIVQHVDGAIPLRQWLKDDMISAILYLEFPPASIPKGSRDDRH